jgi:hypothetical protein
MLKQLNLRLTIIAVAIMLPVLYGFTRASTSEQPSTSSDPGRAQRDGKNGVVTELSGHVESLLAEVASGEQRQEFLMRLTPELSLWVHHSTESGNPVPLMTGDRVRVRGVYDWTPEGGVLRTMNSGPTDESRNGWVMRRGVVYR